MIQKLLIAILIALNLGCQDFKFQQKGKSTRAQKAWNPNLQKFSSCQEIDSYLESFRPDTDRDTSFAIPISLESHYQPQVENVNEGDILQSHPDLYFFSRPDSIEILRRSDLTVLKSLSLPGTPQHRLFYIDTKLISISSGEKTTVRIFDGSQKFKLVSHQTLQGQLVDYRVLDQKLIIVTSRYGGPTSALPCSEVYRPNYENGSVGLTTVSRIEIQNLETPIESLSLWGETSFFHMTDEELFLFQSMDRTQFNFRVVNWSTGVLKFVQSHLEAGYVKNRSAVHKQNANLFIATTNSDGPGQPLHNQMLSYQEKDGTYNRLSISPQFGKNEDIRSVHYLNDKAYIVTFEKTDPLFILDLSQPSKIEILSQLTVPGFSTELRPLDLGRLIGVGYDVPQEGQFSLIKGIKVSLFNIQDSLNPMTSGSLVWGDRGSSSEATSEQKALLVAGETKQFWLPLVELTESTSCNSSDRSSHRFSGAIQLRATADNLIEERRFTHQKWREKVCGADAHFESYFGSSITVSMDIQRLHQAGDCVDTFSRFGVMRFCPDVEAATIEKAFSHSTALCKSE